MTPVHLAISLLGLLVAGAALAAEGPVPEPRLGLFVDAAQIRTARKRCDTEPWAAAMKQRVLSIADAWVNRDDAWIRGILPPPGSRFAYGTAGCPACGKGWKYFGANVCSLDKPLRLECPHCKTVFDLNDPKGEYADAGDGVVVSGRRFWLRATWNGFVVNRMWSSFGADESAVVNLADAYALTGDDRYARKLIVILDALATLSPTTNGPRDFVADPGVDQGRLQHLTSIYFRALMHATRALDMVGRHPMLREPSPTRPGTTIWDNIRTGLFEDYLFVPFNTRNGRLHTLHNHEADSYRGLLLAGLTYGIPDYIRWSAEGLQAFLDNTLDRDGLYYETSLSYTGFTRTIFLDMAELLARYDPARYGGAAVPSRSDLPYDANFFNHPRLARLTLETPSRVSILGREPTFGNNHFDTLVWRKPGRPVERWEIEQIQRFLLYATDPAIRETAAKAAARLAPEADPPTGAGTWGYWALYNTVDMPGSGGGAEPAEESDLFGRAGLVYLRSGEGAERRGAVLRVGPNLPHSHDDGLALMLFARGRALAGDVGYGIYGNHVHLGWATQAVAHNVVVVNQNGSGAKKLFRYGPGGDILRFGSAPGVSWVEADLARQFAPEDGVKMYRRAVLQIDLSPEAFYWVDLFDVDGGTVHDYSLHGPPLKGGTFSIGGVDPKPIKDAWTLAGLDPKWRDAPWNSRGNSWGERLTPGGLIRKVPGLDDGVSSNPWWYAPPENGYGFLYDVATAGTDKPWSAMWRWGSGDDRYGLRLTMLPDDIQQVITAKGPVLDGTDAMPFVIARSGSPDRKEPLRTRYTAVLEAFAATPEVTALPLNHEGGASGVRVTAGDREDVILDERASSGGGLGIIRRVNGGLSGLVAIGMPALAADGFTLKAERPVYRGKVASVSDDGLRFTVSPALPECAAGATLVVSNPAYTHRSTYRVGEVHGGEVTPLLSDVTLARGRVRAATAGGFSSAVPLVTTSVHEQDLRFLDGKEVRFPSGAARIAAVKGFFDVTSTGADPKPGEAFVVYDIQAGDTVTMDGTASLTRENDGTWSLRSNIPVSVGFPWPAERRTPEGWKVCGRSLRLTAADLAKGPVRFRRAR
jgi:hypothetical protein